MEMYLLKSAACLAILLLFYKLLLEKENMHSFKRIYLLASVVISVVIPFITFTTYVDVPVSTFIYETSSIEKIQKGENQIKFLPLILWSIYGIGVLFFSIIFLKNLTKLIIKIRRNQKIRKNQVTNVLLEEEVIPHTFWDYIFLNKAKFEAHAIPAEVFQHEEAHAIQKHSFDILFMELLQIIFWFNPLIYFTKNAIKLNHEFLADEAVLKNGTNTAIYQETLLSFSSDQRNGSLSHSINYSSIKKRFTVMKTKTSKKGILARGFLLLPLLAVLLYSFSTKETISKNGINVSADMAIGETLELRVDKNGNIFFNGKIINPEELQELIDSENYSKVSINAFIYAPKTISQNLLNTILDKGFSDGVKLCTYGEPEKGKISVSNQIINIQENSSETILNLPNGEEVIVATQEKATPGMVKEYNKLAKFYADGVTREMIETKGQKEIEKEFARLRYIYSIMTEKQKKTAEKMPPPPPPVEVKGFPSPEAPPAPPVPEEGKIPPPPPPVEVMGYPAPPPPPPSPMEAVKKWTAEGAEFFFNGKKITAKEAENIVQEKDGKNLSVRVEENKSGKTVFLSDNKRNK